VNLHFFQQHNFKEIMLCNCRYAIPRSFFRSLQLEGDTFAIFQIW
jgi:hypothetical protein